MRWRLVLAIWVVLLVAPPANADIDESAYQAGTALQSEAERRHRDATLAAEREAEKQRAAEAALASERAQAERLAHEAARPHPERLTEQHCTRCHPAENYTAKGHTWLVWRMVVARMVWLNEAEIPLEVQSVITTHLAAAYPASSVTILAEYGFPSAVLALLAAAAWIIRRFLRPSRE
jgi:hypothetical protein